VIEFSENMLNMKFAPGKISYLSVLWGCSLSSFWKGRLTLL